VGDDALIVSVLGRRVWDSRGRPTVEVEVRSEDGALGRAIAPAGASTGRGEAVELRDGGERLGGLDVGRAVANVNGEIAAAVVGLPVAAQRAVDDRLAELDGTGTFARLGGNASVATSLACLHTAAAGGGLPLWQHLDPSANIVPLPEIQIFGGGAHAGRRIDIQDLMVMVPSADSFGEALEATAEIHRRAGEQMAARVGRQGVADEGGWWPAFDSNEQAIEALVDAIGAAGFTPGRDVVVSLDVAASELWRDGRYHLGLDQRVLDSDAMVQLVLGWCDRFPIASVEDPLGEDDVAGLRAFTTAVAGRVQVVGDDVFVTDGLRVEGLEGVATAVLVKPNQAGTVTRAHDALLSARATGRGTVVSARSGESEDVTIAHLAVGWGAGQLKVGSMTRGERTAKWNEVLRIEEALGGRGRYAGWGPLGFSRPAG
jgi:enolase